MNPLLGPFKRNVRTVELPVRTDLKIFVRQHTAGENLRYHEAVSAIPDGERQARFVPMCLAAHVCDAEGQLLLTFEEAQKFVDDHLYPLDVKALCTAAAEINALSDQAVGEAEKN
jgi:hypothetical protein